MRYFLHYCPLLSLMFLFFRCDAQDMLVQTSGDVKNVKVLEVTTNFVRYRVTDSSDSSFYRISTDSVYSIKYKNDLLPRELALKRIWGSDTYFNGRSMDVYIAKLRKYLKEDATVEIVNIHGNGFRLVVPEQ